MNKCSLWQRIALPCLAVLALAGCSGGSGNAPQIVAPPAEKAPLQLEAWVGEDSSQLRLSRPIPGLEIHASSDPVCEFDTDNTMGCTDPNIYTLNNTTEAFTDTALTLNHPGYYQLRQGEQRLNTLLSPSRFSPRAVHQAVFFNGEFWLIGGDLPGGNGSSAEIWSSPDGVQWVLRDAEAEFGPLAYHQVVVYQNKLWVIGGWKDDGINAGTQQAVWASEDGLNWESKTSLPIALNRHQVVVFENIAATEPGDPENTLWVMGGLSSSDVDSATNDVYLLHNGDWITPQIALGETGTSGKPLPKLFGHQVVAFNAGDGEGEQLWVIGGMNESFQRNNDIWRSSDGYTWNKVELDPEEERFSARFAHQAVVFDDQLWVIGGHDGTYKNDIWSSPDGEVWTEQDPPADFPPRTLHQVVVANDGADESLWLIGGDSCGGCFLNDTWSSSDGEHWQHRSAQAEFFARYGHQVVSFDDGTGEQLWLIGGYDGQRYLNDLWTSPDGLNWTPVDVDRAALFTPRDSHGAVVFNDQLWVIGGADGNSQNDVWSSPNGITWTEHTQPAGAERFSPRQSPQAVVFDDGDGDGDKLWLIGGYGFGLDDNKFKPLSDVWSSVDGDTWTKHSSDLNVGQYDHQVVVFNNGAGNGEALWLLGRDGNGAAAIWSSTNGENWSPVEIKLTDGTPILPRAGYQAVAFNQQLWVIGGQNPVSNNVWVSSNGSDWALTPSGDNPFAARQYHQAVVFNNALFVIGGADEEYAPFNDVWKSTDGLNWQLGLKTNIQALER
ncbi:kelch repeat-containing protein [Saccharospirillum mangrovi]|uniref:Kelch repeat-containing protein n=1 Tax=Saccharospirillum mangrovi TaxID=2161747 RepID=UPI000D36F713|nr:kelch repeat-containing protein [Saccharospirillum mangrovi]